MYLLVVVCQRAFVAAATCDAQTRWLDLYHPILYSLLDILHPRFQLFPVRRPNGVLQRCLEEFLHVCPEQLRVKGWPDRMR